ncbi:MAG: BMP family ABC transporter substrate-binding protein [Candidatus Rokuibacteriota bacterium]
MERRDPARGRLLLCALVIASLILPLLGAPAPASTEALKPQPTVKAAFIYLATVGDGGWTLAHDEARKATEQKLQPFLTTAYSEGVAEGAAAEQIIERYVRQGYNLIFATSFGYMDAVLAVAKRHPDVVFMHASGIKSAANVGTYYGRMYQARYLTGLVAGKMTKSQIVGYVAAHPTPTVVRGINAFALGVRAANPKAKVRVVWTNSWYDAAKEREAAESLLDFGADVITQHQDTPATQQAAERRGRYSIGYNADMRAFAPKAHLTAAIWRWERLYTDTVKQVQEGTWKSAHFWPGIESGVVDLAPFSEAVPAEVRTLVEAKKADIAAKRTDVFTGPIRDQEGNVVVEAGKALSDAEIVAINFLVEGVVGTLPKRK